jgi:hypothetical protein
MVNQARGTIFKRTDGRYFLYLPKALVEDSAYPFEIQKRASDVWIHFKLGDKKLVIEKDHKK